MSRPKTLNGYFIKKGEYFSFYGFPEPCYDEVIKTIAPRFEIFFKHKFTLYEDPFLYTPPIMTNKEDWADFLGNEYLDAFMGEE